MLACLKSLDDVVFMGVIGRGDDHHVYVLISEQIPGCGIDFESLGPGLVVRFRAQIIGARYCNVLICPEMAS